MRYTILILCVILSIGVSGCSLKGIKKEASYPTRPDAGNDDKILYSDEKADTIWGEDESIASRFFGKDNQDNGSGIGVNSFLWRASLDTIAFMPVKTADPFGGVILTEWYENPNAQGERFKVNVYIMDKQLRSDGVKVAVFKQKVDKRGRWRDSSVNDETNLQLENTILTRARELKVAQKAAEE